MLGKSSFALTLPGRHHTLRFNNLVNTLLMTFGALVISAAAQPLPPDKGGLPFDSLPEARFKFMGLVGERVQANVDNWLLRAPQSNPGMIEMFTVRDRHPVPQLVPWAGE